MNDFTERLFKVREKYSKKLPCLADAKNFADQVLGLLFPHYVNCDMGGIDAIKTELKTVQDLLTELLEPLSKEASVDATKEAAEFMNALPNIYEKLWKDAEAILMGDPAAQSVDEVIIAYPGFYATAIYRIAHHFYEKKIPIFPRILSEHAHQLTGIDIHPGAQIGDFFCIDHGTGIVIGETSIIYNHVKIYQGVGLGALSVEKKFAGKKRHPTIEDNVVIYANATILGGDTTIGRGSVIGGNVWITSSIPANSVVYHQSEQKIKNLSSEKREAYEG